MYRHSLQAWYVADSPHKSFHLISPFYEKPQHHRTLLLKIVYGGAHSTQRTFSPY